MIALAMPEASARPPARPTAPRGMLAKQRIGEIALRAVEDARPSRRARGAIRNRPDARCLTTTWPSGNGPVLPAQRPWLEHALAQQGAGADRQVLRWSRAADIGDEEASFRQAPTLKHRRTSIISFSSSSDGVRRMCALAEQASARFILGITFQHDVDGTILASHPESLQPSDARRAAPLAQLRDNRANNGSSASHASGTRLWPRINKMPDLSSSAAPMHASSMSDDISCFSRCGSGAI